MTVVNNALSTVYLKCKTKFKKKVGWTQKAWKTAIVFFPQQENENF